MPFEATLPKSPILDRFLNLYPEASTRKTYSYAVWVWTRINGFKTPEAILEAIRSASLDVYDSFLALRTKVKSNTTFKIARSGVYRFLRSNKVPVNKETLSDILPKIRKYQETRDAIPEVEDLKKIILRASPRLKAAISVLASSGMRPNELVQLTVGDITWRGDNEWGNLPTMLSIPASVARGKYPRVTFISNEASELLKAYLTKSGKLGNKKARLFDCSRNTLSDNIKDIIDELGLGEKDHTGRRIVHTYSLRKFFYSRMKASGLDSLFLKKLMGHGGLDEAYDRNTANVPATKYQEKMDSVTILSRSDAETQRKIQAVVEKASKMAETQKALREQLDAIRAELEAERAKSNGSKSFEVRKISEDDVEGYMQAIAESYEEAGRVNGSIIFRREKAA